MKVATKTTAEKMETQPNVVDSRAINTRKSPAWRAYVPDFLLVLIPIGFCLMQLTAETWGAPYVNDSAMHLQMVRWADGLLEAGRSPLDGWYPLLQLGSAHFPHYQSLPHIVTAFAAQLVGPETAFQWALYLLLSLWPASVYLTARLFSLGRLPAVIAAVISPLVGSLPGIGYEVGSYMWRGYGVWSQLWGMMLIGPAMALSWRFVSGKGKAVGSATALAFTVALHFLTGYLAFVSLGIWVLAAPTEFLRRLRRALVAAAGAILIGSWVLVPLFRDSEWIARTVYNLGSQDLDSFGAPKVLQWLISGEIYDTGRFPILTMLVFAGITLSLVRFKSEPLRCLLGLFLLSFVLYSGRPTFGPLLDRLPGGEELFYSRFIIGLHLAGVLLAGVAGAAAARTAGSLVRQVGWPSPKLVGPAVALLGLLALTPALRERTQFINDGETMISRQLAADSSDGALVDELIEQAKRLGGGRIYAGTRGNWGADYLISDVPVYARVTDRMGDGLGFTFRTGGLSSDIESVIDDFNPASFDMLNARYVIAPDDLELKVPAKLLAQRGIHILWEVETTGYLKVVETIDPISADHANILEKNGAFITSENLGKGLHPTVAFNGRPAQKPTTTVDTPQTEVVGEVKDQFDDGGNGRYGGTVNLNRKGVVMLKSSFDPRWTASVDGEPAKPFMVAPSFVGVEVGPGEHEVSFQYVAAPGYPYLFLIGLLTFLALYGIPKLTAPSVGKETKAGPIVKLRARLKRD